MSDSEYKIKAVKWKKRHEAEFSRIEKEIKEQELKFKTNANQPWWKKIFKI